MLQKYTQILFQITLLAFGAFMNPVGIWTLLKRDKKSICNYLTMALFVSEMGYIIVSGGAIAVRGQAVSLKIGLYLYSSSEILCLLGYKRCVSNSSLWPPVATSKNLLHHKLHCAHASFELPPIPFHQRPP